MLERGRLKWPGNRGAASRRPTPQLPQWLVVRVDLRTLDGQAHPLAEAQAILRHFALTTVLHVVSNISAHLWHSHKQVDYSAQKLWLTRLCSDDLRGRIASWAKSTREPLDAVFFDQVQLLAAVREALIACPDSLADTTRPDTDLGRALLILNGNLENESGAPESDEWFIAKLVPGMLLSRPEPWTNAVARWECILRDIPSRHRGLAWSFDLPEGFRQATGHDLLTYRALVFGTLATFVSLIDGYYGRARDSDDESSPLLALSHPHWLRNFTLQPSEAGLVDQQLMATSSELRMQFAESNRAHTQPLFFTPLLQRPLVKVGTRVWCPAVFALERKVTVGAYDTIFAHLQSAGRDPQPMQRARGQAFDIYVRELTERMCRQVAGRSIYYPNRDWKADNRKRCDLLIVEGNRAVAVEVKSGLVTEEVFIDASFGAFQSYIEHTVAYACKQLAHTIQDIESMHASVRASGISPATISAYAPIVVTLESIPKTLQVDAVISRAVKSAYAEVCANGGADISRKCRRVEVFDVRALEMLENELSRGHSTLCDVVFSKLAADPAGNQSAWDFCVRRFGRQLGSTHLDTVFRGLGEEMSCFWDERRRRSSA